MLPAKWGGSLPFFATTVASGILLGGNIWVSCHP